MTVTSEHAPTDPSWRGTLAASAADVTPGDASSAVVARAQRLILDGLRRGAMVGMADSFTVDNNYAATETRLW